MSETLDCDRQCPNRRNDTIWSKGKKWKEKNGCHEGPGGVWCDVDVVEFAYYGPPETSPKEQLYSELMESLRGCDSTIGSGSQVPESCLLSASLVASEKCSEVSLQVASQKTYGTLGCIVRSLTPEHELGFLTNRHVAVDLDHPHQKMFHPLPPSLGPGVYLGSVGRATTFITDDLWYGVFASLNEERDKFDLEL
ncbi:hypothetical protein Mapa_007317 [Marchantia paleacea]|nr:hypothetical protein Mapa_007317 [Marchantia paleacea]